jgi:pseudaminic acid cytidylyltransferase
MTKRLLIIPARKNSKRIKNKNIKIFKGRPIISYSIEIAKKSGLFEKIHISTDSNKIKKISLHQGIKIDFMRPRYLSDDITGLMEVYSYIVDKYKKMGEFYEEIWFLSACSPLISSDDLIKASKFFNLSKTNSMLSICKFSPKIQKAYNLKNNIIFPLKKTFMKKNSQDIPDRYFHTGNFGAFKNSVFNKKKLILRLSGFELPKEKSIDIDDMNDWKMTLKLFEN